MSTRAVFSFIESAVHGGRVYHVYSHYDGYESGAAVKIACTLEKAWALPRFEADEFGASFIAANKTNAGGVRLTFGPEYHSDIEYHYEIFLAEKNDQLCIKAWHIDGLDRKEQIFYGRVKDFIAKYGDDIARKNWNKFGPPSDHPLPLEQSIKEKALAKLTAEEKKALGLSSLR